MESRTEAPPRPTRFFVVFLGVCFGLAYWIIDAAVETYIFGAGSLGSQIVSTEYGQLPVRVSIVALFLLISVYTQITLNRQHRAERSLEKYAHDLSTANRELETARHELAQLNQNLENKVQERTEEVEKLLKQKDDFIVQLGHDLNSPLTPLVILLPIMKKRERDEKQRELLETLMVNVDYMREVTAKTLQLAKLNSPTSQVVVEDTNLREQIETVLERRKDMVAKREIRVDDSVQGDVFVKADRFALRELLDNLVVNALRFTPEGGLVVIDAKKEKGIVTVSVRDNGIGMSSDQLSSAFDEFYKADGSRHELSSSGLGLTICRRIMEKHAGKIWAHSEGLGKGTTVFFTLEVGSARVVEPVAQSCAV